MFKPDKWLQSWYDKYNVRYFEGKLPVGAQIQVGWNDGLKDTHLGNTVQFEENEGNLVIYNISLHPQLKQCGRQHARFTLLHEMVHVYIIQNKLDNRKQQLHGKRFQQEMMRLAADGAFNKLW